MMKNRLMIALVLAGCSNGVWASGTALAGKTLPGTDVSDRVVSQVVSAPLPAGQFERAPVQFAWALDPSDPVLPAVPEVMESRSFWQMVDAASLQRGLELQLSAPGAVIQISPAQGAAAIDAQAVQVLDAASGGVAVKAFETAQLEQAGMPVAAGTTLLKLQGNEADRVTVKLNGGKGRYVVQVLEPHSPVVLRARTERTVALAGSQVGIQVDLDGVMTAPSALAARLGRSSLAAEGLLVAPDGRTWPVAFRANRSGGLSAAIDVPAGGSDAPGLWEVQVFADQAGIARDTRLAFAVARPTARLAGAVRASNPAQIRFPLQLGAPGRYEVRATLFATGADGAMRPVAQGHSAAWFAAAGNGELMLSFADVALPAGYGAPFELREVELHDQTRVAAIERRAKALRF